MKNRLPVAAAFAAVMLFLAQSVCRADSSASGAGSLLEPVRDYFESWFDRVSRTQAEQPHWITPLVTVTPRLEEELRYDQSFQARQHGETLTNFGGGKGLELIPWDTVEVILGIPPYLSHEFPGKNGAKNRGTDDFGDWSALVKYRLLSANEESGNYILTLFFGIAAPTGTEHNSQGHALFTPTIALGKGWGDFDFQSTLGATFPNGGLDRLGMPVAYNTAFQYRVFKYFWPEFEVNYTWFPDGEHAGKSEVFLTPGMVIGRLPIYQRVGATFGAGFQVAVTKFNRYHNAWILSGRIPF